MNLICGINPVLEALAAGERHFERLLVVKGIRNRRISEAISRASRMGIPLRFEARETLDRIAAGVPHQGLVAVVSTKAVLDLETVLGEARDPALLVVLDGVEDPRNLGAILRTSEAAGVDGVLLPERRCAGLSETVGRTSAGGLEHVRVARIGNVVAALEAVKARGIWVVGFDSAGSERWDAVDYARPIAIVLGGEGRGIRRFVRERCDHVVSLPLFGHVRSLNVSVAAGIALYEVIRQRRAIPSHVRPIPLRPHSSAPTVVGPAPDDTQDDPGSLHSWADAGVEPGIDDELDEQSRGVTFSRDSDEPAWSGPTILVQKPRHGRRWPRPGPRPGPRPHARADAAPSPQPPAEGAAPASSDPRRRRRRRRKDRAPLQGAPGDSRGATDAQPGHDDSAVDSGPRPDVPGATPGDGQGRGRRRRRRRRR
jgi:23S rRNA (guanosine2251-2'-O)-methyltransferase